MKTLEDYEVDELVDVLRELKYRHVEDDDLADEIDSLLDMLKRGDDE